MALTDEGGMNTTMLVSPTGGYGNNGNNGFGDGNGWWIILLLLLVAGGWNNNGGGYGGNGGGGFVPFAVNTGNEVQRGFDQSAIMSGIGDINGGIYGIQNALCNGFAGVNASVANGFAQSEIANNARQMANMNQIYGLSSQFAECCCENRLGIANLGSDIAREACATRTNDTQNTQSLLNAINGGIISIKEQLCSDKIDAKNEKIADLERQLTMANLAASQTAQTAQLLADNSRQTTALEQYLNPVPVPAYVVANPNCCQQNSCGCGCG